LFLSALVACGGGTSIVDAGPDAALLDASREADAGGDASVDAGVACAVDSDCLDAVDSACLRGRCAPAPCFSLDPTNYGCGSGLDCIGSRCLPAACGDCPAAEVCDPASGGCVAPVDAVTCRAGGGLYVRGRCMMSDATDAGCDGGFASETVPGTCDAPTIAGANLDGPAIVRVGPFPVAKVESPVAGSLTAYLESVRERSFLWRFRYADPSVPGGAVEAALVLTPQEIQRDGVSCVAPAGAGFAPTPLCDGEALPSGFDCSDLPVAGGPSGEGLVVVTHVRSSSVGVVRLDSGGWGIDEITTSDSGDSTQRPLIRPDDVGGTIVAITDLASEIGGEPCGDLSFLPQTLIGAMLDIRLADGSVVHELWAVAIKGGLFR